MIKERDYLFDNAKFLLMALVVIGHFIEPIVQVSHGIRVAYLVIYLFHMPCFILITGYLSRYQRNPIASLKQLGLQYLIFQLLYIGFEQRILHREDQVFSLAYPFWVLWFLIGLMAWKVMAAFLQKKPGSMVLVTLLALWVGIYGWVGYKYSLSRILVFFPFYFLGACLEKKHITQLKNYRVYLSISSVLIITFFIVQAERLDYSWFWGGISYHHYTDNMWLGAGWRLLTLVGALILSLTFLTYVPFRELKISKLGQNTLGVFLLHGIVQRYWRVNWVWAGVPYANTLLPNLLLASLTLFVFSWPGWTIGIQYVTTVCEQGLFKLLKGSYQVINFIYSKTRE